MFITLVNARPSVGSYEKPLQLPPPSVLGNVTHRAVHAGRRVGPFVYIALSSQSVLQ